MKKFPTVSSHYRRKETSKWYFESDVTMATMYRLFKEEHPATKIHITTYSKIIKTLRGQGGVYMKIFEKSTF